MKLTDSNGKKITTQHPDLSKLTPPKNDFSEKGKFQAKPKQKKA